LLTWACRAIFPPWTAPREFVRSLEQIVPVPVHVQKSDHLFRHRSARGDVALVGASIMEKLQEIVDTVFGAINNQPAPQSPNEFTVQRQRAFDESARKIEALRRARLGGKSLG
jgi:hypothetical protein